MLGEWPVQADMWDGRVLCGPIPKLFAPNPEETTKNMEANPKNVYKDLNRIYSKFFVSENTAPEDAFELLTNPR